MMNFYSHPQDVQTDILEVVDVIVQNKIADRRMKAVAEPSPTPAPTAEELSGYSRIRDALGGQPLQERQTSSFAWF